MSLLHGLQFFNVSDTEEDNLLETLVSYTTNKENRLVPDSWFVARNAFEHIRLLSVALGFNVK